MADTVLVAVTENPAEKGLSRVEPLQRTVVTDVRLRRGDARPVPHRARRVVVYAAGDAGRIAQQQDACALHAAEAGLTIAGLAVDDEIGESRGWLGAVAMLTAGDVDAILVDDRVVVPGLIVASVAPGRRRTVPAQRGGAR